MEVRGEACPMRELGRQLACELVRYEVEVLLERKEVSQLSWNARGKVIVVPAASVGREEHVH